MRLKVVAPDLKVGQAELVRRDDEAAARSDQNGCKGGILAVFQTPLRIALK
jgi:hypothetical protein